MSGDCPEADAYNTVMVGDSQVIASLEAEVRDLTALRGLAEAEVVDLRAEVQRLTSECERLERIVRTVHPDLRCPTGKIRHPYRLFTHRDGQCDPRFGVAWEPKEKPPEGG